MPKGGAHLCDLSSSRGREAGQCPWEQEDQEVDAAVCAGWLVGWLVPGEASNKNGMHQKNWIDQQNNWDASRKNAKIWVKGRQGSKEASKQTLHLKHGYNERGGGVCDVNFNSIQPSNKKSRNTNPKP